MRCICTLDGRIVLSSLPYKENKTKKKLRKEHIYHQIQVYNPKIPPRDTAECITSLHRIQQTQPKGIQGNISSSQYCHTNSTRSSAVHQCTNLRRRNCPRLSHQRRVGRNRQGYRDRGSRQIRIRLRCRTVERVLT